MNLHEWKEYVLAEAGIAEAKGADLDGVVRNAVKALSRFQWEKTNYKGQVFSTIVPPSKVKGLYKAAASAVREALSAAGVECSERASRGDIVADEQGSTMFTCPGGQVHIYTEINSGTGKFDLVIYAE